MKLSVPGCPATGAGRGLGAAIAAASAFAKVRA